MISVSEAKNIIQQNVRPLNAVIMPLPQAAGCMLAHDVFASYDIPAFAQSNMDGYAFKFKDHLSNNSLQIKGVIQAGAALPAEINAGEAMRIFTGAPIPANADTVVMQEKVAVHQNKLIIQDDALIAGSNVRLKGAEIKQGELALEKNTYLSAASIGFVAGIGISHVFVYPKPAVHIIVTGKELQQLNKPLQHGQVYESNSYMLMAALQQLHINNVKIFWADDDLTALQKLLQQSLNEADIVLLTGGVSVGDYDFVVRATELCGVMQLFHKIKQKPGKPLYAGLKDNKIVMGLPGNPSSVLTCFYEYVIEVLRLLSSSSKIIQVKYLPLAKALEKKEGLTHFLKAKIFNNAVMPLHAQESYRLSSFAVADCLIVLDEVKTFFNEGDSVEVHILPF